MCIRDRALSLIRKGYKVTVINKNYADCHSLAEIQAMEVIYGDASKPYVLEEAGADRMDIAIALTQNDEDNLVICELCKKRFGTAKTVALVNDPKKTEFFYSMGIDSVVCAINVVAGIIEPVSYTHLDVYKRQVFDLFYTGEYQAADGTRSMGVGLSLCRSIVEAHGGKLEVRDNVPKGTCFLFDLKAEDVGGDNFPETAGKA